MTEGYVTRMALDEENQVIGYEFVHLGKMMEAIKKAWIRLRLSKMPRGIMAV